MVNADAIERLKTVARHAGAAAMRHYGTADATLKADRSPVTAADRAAHEVIALALAEWTPDIPMISEEGDIPSFDERRHWTRFWLVDPLDGTKEFLQQNGEFTVNIALIEHGEPVLGVVYAPALELLYYAGRDLGSWRQEGSGQPVRLLGPDRPGADGLIVVESRSHPSAELEAYLAERKVARRVKSGSSLKFGVLAEGRAHVYPRLGPTMEWDVAAGDCVWRYAARGEPHPSPLQYNTPDLRNTGFVVGLESDAEKTPAAPSAGHNP